MYIEYLFGVGIKKTNKQKKNNIKSAQLYQYISKKKKKKKKS
jgi:hypothetical protein